MKTTGQAILGVQLTLVGLYFVTYFEGVSSLPIAGLVLGLVGTAVTVTAAVRTA